MNHEEAKFLLRARRPGGRDAGEAVFAEALREAERDPQLKAWQAREEAFDAAMERKLAAIEPPAGLREAILAGARAGETARESRVAWRRPVWLAAAAAVVLAATAAVVAMRVGGGGGGGLAAEELAGFALNDLAGAHDEHVGRPAGLETVQARLASAQGSLRGNLRLDVEELRRGGCRAVRVGGREVFEVCFRRDGAWYHLYVMRASGGVEKGGAVKEVDRGRMVAATWSDGRNAYALITEAGRDALRKVVF